MTASLPLYAQFNESPEAFLTRRTSKDVFKAAKDLMRTGTRLCGNRDAHDRVYAMFRDKKGEVIEVTCWISADECGYACSVCGESDHLLCPHAFAALLMDMKHVSLAAPPEQEQSLSFGGLKNIPLRDLAVTAPPGHPQTYLTLEMVGDFPHIPSKWENATFVATLMSRDKSYKGNLSNMRLLHFEKRITDLFLEDFSLQERQIIRYLAIYAAGESGVLTLGSEETAEFLHALRGFPRLFRNNQRIIIHEDDARVVLYDTPVRGKAGIQKLQVALRYGETVLPLSSTRVITGRSCVWAGYKGEYFFIPALQEIAWLRALFRFGSAELPEAEAEAYVRAFESGGLSVIHARRAGELRTLTPSVLLSGAFDPADETFSLRVGFVYKGRHVRADLARLIEDDGRYALRDNALESELIEQLRYFGFKQPESDPSVFRLYSLEAAFRFLTLLLPLLLKKNVPMFMDGALMALARPVEIKASFTSQEVGAETSTLCGFFSPENDPSQHWTFAAVTAHFTNHKCAIFHQGVLCMISPKLHRFVEALAPLLKPAASAPDTYKILSFNIPFYVRKAGDIPGLVPEAWLMFARSIEPHVATENVSQIASEPLVFEGALRAYQQSGVNFVEKHFAAGLNVVLADEMGLGKTVQVLAVLARRRMREKVPNILVCPTSLCENWRREAAHFVPSLRVTVIEGSDRARLWKESDQAQLIILSYALLRIDFAHAAKRVYDVLILDEAQQIKNPDSQVSKNCKALHAAHRMVLTGTPLENSPRDLWSIFEFLHPGLLGPRAQFAAQYEAQGADKESLQRLGERCAAFVLRRKKADVCAELPEKTEQTVYCTLQGAQRKLYDRVLAEARLQFGTKKKLDAKACFDILTALLRLRQICCDPRLLPETFGEKAAESAKMELLFTLLSKVPGSGHKVLLFSQFTSLLALVRARLDADKVPYCYLDGTTTNRQDVVDQFNESPEIGLFLLSLKAGGTGLNLTGADTIILYDPWWNPAVENQAADRAHRIGQHRNVQVIRLLARDSIEERIWALRNRKQALFDALIEDPARRQSTGGLSMQDLQKLLE